MAVSKQVSLFVLEASVRFVQAVFDGTKVQAQRFTIPGLLPIEVMDPLPYDPQRLNWDMAGTACAAWGADKSLDLRKRYGWAAMVDLPCGMCLKATSSQTGASLVVRVVDKCDSRHQADMSVLQKIGSVLAYEEYANCDDNN